jgi:hypothetical protein
MLLNPLKPPLLRLDFVALMKACLKLRALTCEKSKANEKTSLSHLCGKMSSHWEATTAMSLQDSRPKHIFFACNPTNLPDFSWCICQNLHEKISRTSFLVLLLSVVVILYP